MGIRKTVVNLMEDPEQAWWAWPLIFITEMLWAIPIVLIYREKLESLIDKAAQIHPCAAALVGIGIAFFPIILLFIALFLLYKWAKRSMPEDK